MGYLHIDNLYKFPDVFLFKEVYCLEKIHGTSANIGWKDGQLRFHSGGVKQQNFVELFDQEKLADAFQNVLGHDSVTVYGEAYGGKCQRMSDTYGVDLRFVAFEVKVGDCWLSVPNAYDVANKLGLEFVSFTKVVATEEALTAERDKPSVQSVRNGIEEPRQREGIVIRPLVELTKNDGGRIIAKYKTEDFRETMNPRRLDTHKLEVLEEAGAIADEWVTPARLEHVLQKLPEAVDMKHTPLVIQAMQEDVEREAAGEVVWSKDVAKMVGRRAVVLWKKRVQEIKT